MRTLNTYIDDCNYTQGAPVKTCLYSIHKYTIAFVAVVLKIEYAVSLFILSLLGREIEPQTTDDWGVPSLIY